MPSSWNISLSQKQHVQHFNRKISTPEHIHCNRDQCQGWTSCWTYDNMCVCFQKIRLEIQPYPFSTAIVVWSNINSSGFITLRQSLIKCQYWQREHKSMRHSRNKSFIGYVPPALITQKNHKLLVVAQNILQRRECSDYFFISLKTCFKNFTSIF